MVVCAVVGGIVDHPAIGFTLHIHRAAAAAVEVYRLGAAQPAHHQFQFCERESLGLVLEAAVGHHQ